MVLPPINSLFLNPLSYQEKDANNYSEFIQSQGQYFPLPQHYRAWNTGQLQRLYSPQNKRGVKKRGQIMQGVTEKCGLPDFFLDSYLTPISPKITKLVFIYIAKVLLYVNCTCDQSSIRETKKWPSNKAYESSLH